MRKKILLMFISIFSIFLSLNIKLKATVMTSDAITTIGAQIRTAQPTGIRFVSQIDFNSLELTDADIAVYGTLIGFGFSEAEELLVDGSYNGKAIAKLEATKLYSSNTFVGSIIDFSKEYYEQNLTARGYIKTNNGDIIYATSSVTKNMYSIACELTDSTSEFVKEVINNTVHHYNTGVITKVATVNQTGEIQYTCNVCGKKLINNILKTPVISSTGSTISWEAVDNATNYYLYKNNKFIKDLGNVTSYTITDNSGINNYIIKAATYDTSYEEESNPSTTAKVTVGYGINLQESNNYDFENFSNEIILTNNFTNHYGNYSPGRVTIITDATDGNAAKLTPLTDNGVSTITKEIGTKVLKAGTYQVLVDVKKGASADGTLAYGIWNGSVWLPALTTEVTLVNLDISSANSTSWTTCMAEYTLAADQGGTWGNFDIRYTAVVAGDDNYVLIDNIRLVSTSDLAVNLDANPNGDFSLFTINSELALDTIDWNNNIFVEGDSLENKIIFENDNSYLKVYSSSAAANHFNLQASPAIATKGTYKVTMKVKLGPNATNVDNIGFRFYASTSVDTGTDNRFSGLDTLSPSKWTTIEAYFTVNQTTAPSWINMYFTVNTNNTNNDLNNYVLIDDIKIQQQKVNIQISSNDVTLGVDSVSFVSWLTGKNSLTNTADNWQVGGTDLGIPYYDASRNKMYFLFGDTFAGVGTMAGSWRSQTVGVTSDFDASDGIIFDSFIHDTNGYAKEIINSRKTEDNAQGERTCIPTGGIVINGTHYVYYMSIETWNDTETGWRVNFCNLAKSTDGENFTKMENVVWVNDTNTAKTNANISLRISAESMANKCAPDFMQIFPYLNQQDGYIYLFGLTSGRVNGVKLARVMPGNIENMNMYEYYQSDGTWIVGTIGLNRLYNNDSAYIVNGAVGELSIVFNPYLNKYVMGYYSDNKIVIRTSKDLVNWSDEVTLTTWLSYVSLYGCFMHEMYFEENGKVMYFFMSQYKHASLGDNGYNVRTMKVVLE